MLTRARRHHILPATAMALAMTVGTAHHTSAQDGRQQAEETEAGRRTLLQRLIVSDTIGSGDPYDEAAPASTVDREAITERFGGDANQVVRSTAGTFTRAPSDQPGLTVNVRGLQGMGRVNTMIDGVPQTFRNLSGHGGTFDDMAYVDTNFLTSVDVQRGSVSGAEGMGALGGAANFRTIGIEDVLLPGRDQGVMTTWRGGTNAYGWSGMIAGGLRTPMLPNGEGMASVMGAFSYTEKRRFENGDGIEVPFDPSQKPSSGLIKVELKPNDTHELKLGGRWYDNAFYVQSGGYDWSVNNQTYTANYAYTPGDPLWDLRVNAYHNITKLDFDGIGGVFSNRHGVNTATGIDISNRSRTSFGNTDLEFYYGAAYSSDDYEGNDQRGANPDGRLIKGGLFGEAALTHGIMSLKGGLRYDRWQLSGVRGYTRPGFGDCPAGGGNCPGKSASRSGDEWNPSITATLKPLDWMEFYATYAHTYRAPTASEMFYPGGHNFNGSGSPIENNLDLTAETMRGIDIGVNVKANDLFVAGDAFRLKAGYFRNRIKNFITYGMDQKPGEVSPTIRWINLPGTTTMSGFELEGGYDAGFIYANFSLTIADTEQPLPYFAGVGNDVGRLPDDFATIDVGTRLFDQRLTLGGRMRYVGDSVQVFFDDANSIHFPSYVLFDAYGSWQFNENAKLFFSVENIADKSYMNAMGGFADSYNGVNTGRGRTFIVGATARF